MSDYESKRDDYSSRRTKAADHGGGSSPDDALDERDSHRKHNSHGSYHKSSRTRDEDKDRGYNRGFYQRGYNGRSSRGDRGRDRSEVYERHQGRDRHGDYKQDRERRYRQRSLSPSGHRSCNQSRSPSPSHARTKSKRTSGFDMVPPGMATLPAAAAAPGQQPGVPQMMPGVVQNVLSFGTTQFSLPLIPSQAITQQATRHARRVYVGGLPAMVNEQAIATFFSGVMAAIGGNSAGPGDAVVNVYINHEKKFAFVEMRTVEEASNAMTLDGIMFEGVSVRVRRPTDYNPALAATLGPSQPSPHLNLAAVQLAPGAIGEVGGADRIFVGGIPYYFNEVQVTELLQSFGPLQRFDLVKDKDTGNSKGYGFCIYQDPAVTDVACDALNGLKMGDKTLTVRRATVSNGHYKSEQENLLEQAQQHILQKMALQVGSINPAGVGMELTANAESPTKVLCLTEAITDDQLRDDEEYEEILEDMKDECNKFGTVVDVIIPRPNQNGDRVSGLGKVFLEYSDTAGCTNARNILNGRKFGGNIVNATFYPEDPYYTKDYSA